MYGRAYMLRLLHCGPEDLLAVLPENMGSNTFGEITAGFIRRAISILGGRRARREPKRREGVVDRDGCWYVFRGGDCAIIEIGHLVSQSGGGFD